MAYRIKDCVLAQEQFKPNNCFVNTRTNDAIKFCAYANDVSQPSFNYCNTHTTRPRF